MISILIRAVSIFVQFMNIVILVRCLLSWLPISHNNPFSQLVYLLSEPILAPIRDMVNKSPIGGGGLDFSPVFAVLFLNVAQSVIISMLRYL